MCSDNCLIHVLIYLNHIDGSVHKYIQSELLMFHPNKKKYIMNTHFRI